MNTSGEAADQVVRMSMAAGEAALKITGEGAKQLAVLLYAILKEQKKTRGRVKLEALVRSGKPLTVFSVRESDMKKFVQEAKRYGILYCAVRDRKGSSDGMTDIMVKEEDAPRINRIVERFQFASVTETAQVKTEMERTRKERTFFGKARNGHPSGPISGKQERTDGNISEIWRPSEQEKSSVHEELKKIRTSRLQDRQPQKRKERKKTKAR